MNKDIVSVVNDYKRQLEYKEYWFVTSEPRFGLVVKRMHPDEVDKYVCLEYYFFEQEEKIYLEDCRLFFHHDRDTQIFDLFHAMRKANRAST